MMRAFRTTLTIFGLVMLAIALAILLIRAWQAGWLERDIVFRTSKSEKQFIDCFAARVTGYPPQITYPGKQPLYYYNDGSFLVWVENLGSQRRIRFRDNVRLGNELRSLVKCCQ